MKATGKNRGCQNKNAAWSRSQEWTAQVLEVVKDVEIGPRAVREVEERLKQGWEAVVVVAVEGEEGVAVVVSRVSAAGEGEGEEEEEEEGEGEGEGEELLCLQFLCLQFLQRMLRRRGDTGETCEPERGGEESLKKCEFSGEWT